MKYIWAKNDHRLCYLFRLWHRYEISGCSSDHRILIFRPCNTQKLVTISQVCLLHNLYFLQKLCTYLVWSESLQKIIMTIMIIYMIIYLLKNEPFNEFVGWFVLSTPLTRQIMPTNEVIEIFWCIFRFKRCYGRKLRNMKFQGKTVIM